MVINNLDIKPHFQMKQICTWENTVKTYKFDVRLLHNMYV
jgi:hypothetical protein